MKFSPSMSSKPPLISKFSFWKAKDFLNFLLFLSPVIFLTEKSDLFKMFMYLRNGILTLLKAEVSITDISYADICFNKFLSVFKDIFGQKYLTPNFHDLQHLAECCKISGPIYDLSGFNFEHVNGIFAKLVKSNNRLDFQLIKKFNMFLDVIEDTKHIKNPVLKNFIFGKKSRQWTET